MAEPEPTPVGNRIPALPGSPEWERWLADARHVLHITERTWPAYLLGWQLRRLFDAGVVTPADAGLRRTLRRQMREVPKTGLPLPGERPSELP
jgi:hypothetical protein